MISKRQNKLKRHRRVRAKISGTEKRPRLSVFRSGKYIYAQLIDDEKGKTLAQSSDIKQNDPKKKPPLRPHFAKAMRGEQGSAGQAKIKKIDSAKNIGKAFGEEMLKKGFKSIVFDRGGYKYHGRVKSLADGLREAGVKF